MTGNASTGASDRLDDRTAEAIMYGSVLVAAVGYAGGLVYLGDPRVALAVYWIAAVGFVGAWVVSAEGAYDDYHRSVEGVAIRRTFAAMGAVIVLLAPAMPALQAAGYALPPLVVGAVLGYGALYVVYACVYLGVRYGPGGN